MHGLVSHMAAEHGTMQNLPGTEAEYGEGQARGQVSLPGNDQLSKAH